MNKLILILACLLLTTATFAQSSIFINPYVGAGTTGITGNRFGNIQRYHNTTSTVVGVQAGSKIGIVQISIGTALLKTGYKIKSISFENQYDPQTGKLISEPLDLVSTIRQVLIPVKAGLNVKRGKLSFIPQVGIAPAIPLGYTDQYVSPSTGAEVSRMTGSFDVVTLLGLASADIAYHVNDHIAATIGPAFNFTLASFTSLPPQPLYGLTGNLGVILSL